MFVVGNGAGQNHSSCRAARLQDENARTRAEARDYIFKRW